MAMTKEVYENSRKLVEAGVKDAWICGYTTGVTSVTLNGKIGCVVKTNLQQRGFGDSSYWTGSYLSDNCKEEAELLFCIQDTGSRSYFYFLEKELEEVEGLIMYM